MKNKLTFIFVPALVFILIPICVLRGQVNLNFYLSPGYSLTTEDLRNCRFSVQCNDAFMGVAELIVTDKINSVQAGSLQTNAFRLNRGSNQFTSLNIPGINTYKYNSSYVINNFIKEGVYDVCLNLINDSTKLNVAEQCVIRDVRLPQIILNNPPDGSVVGEKNPVFTWFISENLPGSEYQLTITEIKGNQSKVDAMNSNPAFFQHTNIRTNTFLFPTYARNFESGKSYAWQVKFRINGISLTQSEIWTFTTKGPSKDTGSGDYCNLKYEWKKGPAIKILDTLTYWPSDTSKLNHMSPGDVIAFSIYAEDYDYLVQECYDCSIEEGITVRKWGPYRDQVKVAWMRGGVLDARITQADYGDNNSMIFQIPLDGWKHDEMLAILTYDFQVLLFDRTGKATDDQIKIEVNIVMEPDTCNNSDIKLSVEVKYPIPPKDQDEINLDIGSCKPVTPQWIDVYPIFPPPPKIEILKVSNLHSNSYVSLLSCYAEDYGDMAKLSCVDGNGVCWPGRDETLVKDPLDFKWTNDQGWFPLLKRGSSTIFVRPWKEPDIPYMVNCKVSNARTLQYKDQDPEPVSLSISPPKLENLCGCDITDALKCTLTKVRDKFSTLEVVDIIVLQKVLLIPPAAIWSWDIVELHWGHTCNCNIPPSTTCDNTVTVAGYCFEPHAVNYIVFGFMCELTDIDIATMILYIQGYKGDVVSIEVLRNYIKKRWKDLKEGWIIDKTWLEDVSWTKGAPNFDQSVWWAVCGYMYGISLQNGHDVLPIAPADPKYTNCKTECPLICPNHHFTVHWGFLGEVFIEGWRP